MTEGCLVTGLFKPDSMQHTVWGYEKILLGGTEELLFFFSSRRRHTRSVSAFLLNRSSDLGIPAEPLFRSFIEARINLSRFVVTGCAAKTSATVTFPSLNLISLFAFCFNIWLNGVAS